MRNLATHPTYDQSPSFIMKVMAYVALAFGLMTVGALFAPAIIPASRGAFIGLGIITMIFIWFSHAWVNLPRPLNFICFGLMALMTGLVSYPIMAYAAIVGGMQMIFTALLATTCLALAAGVFAMTTKKDLTGMGGFLFMALMGLIVVSFLQIFWFNEVVELISAGVGVVLFSAFIAYDVQMIKHFPEDRAMEAAIMLYVSLFNLFTSILRLMIALRD